MHLVRPIYKGFLKPLYFRFDPEDVHDRMLIMGRIFGKLTPIKYFFRKVFSFKDPKLNQEIGGILFENPIGLSAGFDKNAELLDILPEIGFGFTQAGSVTYNSYDGNPKPRLTRLPKSKGIVVYYGLKNNGVKEIAKRLPIKGTHKFPVSISIAKTNASYTKDEKAGIQDYFDCMLYLEENNLGDFYTINISCPNTFGGEPFTTPQKLERLLQKLDQVKTTRPIFIKMPINLDWKDFNDLLKVIVEHNVKGVIIGNLTKVRDPKLIKDELSDDIKGGISGLPTKDLCNNLIAKTYKAYSPKLVIIGVGGVFSADDAYEKIKLGASLVQLITGMIFEGPQLIGEINKGIAKKLTEDGYTSVSQAIGANILK